MLMYDMWRVIASARPEYVIYAGLVSLCVLALTETGGRPFLLSQSSNLSG